MRVFPDPKTGILQLEWREDGRRLTRSLGHRDWVRAKRQADEFAAGFVGPEIWTARPEAEPDPLTLEKLFDIYGDEVTPTKAEASQRYDRATMSMFLKFFGRRPQGRRHSPSGTGTASFVPDVRARPDGAGGLRPIERFSRI